MQVLTLSNGTSVVVKELLLDHTYVPEPQQICPTYLLIVLIVAVPLGLLGLVSWLRQTPGEPASFLRGFMLTLACTVALTDLIKNYVGYLRPYFYDECGFDPATRTCTHPKADAHKSFPSGHASMSFCSMLFTSLFLAGKVVEQPLKLHTCLGEQDCANVALLLALCPLMLAFWIASSRVRENDHHPADVVFGAFIGSGWALFWYARYFRPAWKSAELSMVSSTDTAEQMMEP